MDGPHGIIVTGPSHLTTLVDEPVQGSECCGGCSGCSLSGKGPQFVQASGGSYKKVVSYAHVGEGRGAYEKEVVTVYYGWRCRKCCLAFLGSVMLCPLVFIGLMYLGGSSPRSTGVESQRFAVDAAALPQRFLAIVGRPAPSPALSPVPAPASPSWSSGVPRNCVLYGDPNVLTFDGRREVYFTPGEYWAVRSSQVNVQVRYALAAVLGAAPEATALALGGAFLDNHVLGLDPENVTWDGRPVLRHLGGCRGWRLQRPYVRITCRKATAMSPSALMLRLPRGVRLEVRPFREPEGSGYIHSQLWMHPVRGQDGHCGNYNGDPLDDTRLAVRARLGRGVAAGELLLPGVSTLAGPGEPDVNDCGEGRLAEALESCKGGSVPLRRCLLDACFGSKPAIAS